MNANNYFPEEHDFDGQGDPEIWIKISAEDEVFLYNNNPLCFWENMDSSRFCGFTAISSARKSWESWMV